ncbi:MAG: hypothetical protein ACXADC_07620 [Candidatus Thorarchaeota archaeon]|jgi:hypothetical protein
MTQNRDELVKLVQQLIDEKIKERRKELLEEREDVHEAMSDIDPSTFKILSETVTDEGDTVIKWEVVEFVTTEFTVDEPHRFERKGTIVIKRDGSSELVNW